MPVFAKVSIMNIFLVAVGYTDLLGVMETAIHIFFFSMKIGWCTPIGGASVWSTPSTNISYTDEKPIVVITAAMDSRSLFHDLTLGVESSVAGMVTVLAVAEALSRVSVSLNVDFTTGAEKVRADQILTVVSFAPG